METNLKEEQEKTEEEEPTIVKLNFNLNSKLNFPKEATLLELKNQISKNFLIREEEYKLFLGDHLISNVNNKTPLIQLVEQYKTTDFTIESSKNFFDLKKQLMDYNEFLDKAIEKEEKEIKEFQEKYISFQNELAEIDKRQNPTEFNGDLNQINLEGQNNMNNINMNPNINFNAGNINMTGNQNFNYENFMEDAEEFQNYNPNYNPNMNINFNGNDGEFNK